MLYLNPEHEPRHEPEPEPEPGHEPGHEPEPEPGHEPGPEPMLWQEKAGDRHYVLSLVLLLELIYRPSLVAY